MFVGFSGNCLRMQKPIMKLAKFSHWDMALGCGPGSREHAPEPPGILTRQSDPISDPKTSVGCWCIFRPIRATKKCWQVGTKNWRNTRVRVLKIVPCQDSQTRHCICSAHLKPGLKISDVGSTTRPCLHRPSVMLMQA